VHKADKPDVIGDLADADILTGEDPAEIDLALSEAQAATLSDRDGAVMERVFERRQTSVGPR